MMCKVVNAVDLRKKNILIFPVFYINTGAIIQSTLSEEQATTHAALLSQLTSRTSSVLKTLDLNGSGDDELTFLRIRSKNREIMIAPEDGFVMVVIQNPNAEK